MQRQRAPAQGLGQVVRQRHLEQGEIREQDRHAQDEQDIGAGQPFPGAELDAPRCPAFAAEHGVTAAAEDPLLAPEQEHRHDQQGHGAGRRHVEARRELEIAPDLGGEHVEAGRQGQDRRRAEHGEGLDDGDERAGEHGRQDHRQGDAPQRPARLAAENGGGFLEVGRHLVEGVGDQREHERERIAGDGEDQAGEGVDVEQRLRLVEPENPAVDVVEDAAVGRGKHRPGDGAEEGRRHEGGCDQAAHQALSRHVGSGDQPGERRRHHAGKEADASGHGQRDQEGPADGGIGEQARQVGEREGAGLVGEGIVAEPEQRQEDQHAQKQGEQREQRRRQIETAKTPWGDRIGGHCCDGHLCHL